ncbi:MAG: chromosome segregation protein SMC [Cyclobacteriaceae bacterium]|nr:chromosome segregation protein SMC [Cyclobacteriaceae bacterium]
MEPNTINSPKKSNRSTIIIIVLLIINIVQGVKIYLDSGEKAQLTTEKINTEQDLASTMQRLNDVKAELDQKIADIQKLGGNIADLEKAKAEVEKELRRSTQRSAKAVKELKDRLDGYEQLLKLKDEEIEKLKSVNKELFTENKTLKTKQNKLSDSINVLSKNKEELAGKVAIASQLKAENISVKAVNSKGKERESPFKNRQLQKIKVEFNLAENKVAPIEGKKILIRVIDENGQVIFDVAKGSGTFLLNGKEEFYTAAQEILFDNTKQKLIFFYEKGTEYAEGNYTVEIFTDSYKMGSVSFAVK